MKVHITSDCTFLLPNATGRSISYENFAIETQGSTSRKIMINYRFLLKSKRRVRIKLFSCVGLFF